MAIIDSHRPNVKFDFTKARVKRAREIASYLLKASYEEAEEIIKAIDPDRKGISGEIIFPDPDSQRILVELERLLERGDPQSFPLDLAQLLPLERIEVWKRRLEHVVTTTSYPQQLVEWQRIKEAEAKYLEGLCKEDEAVKLLEEIEESAFYVLSHEETEEPGDGVTITPRRGKRAVERRVVELANKACQTLFTQRGKLTLRYWRGSFYEWVGTHYRELPRHDLRPRLSRFIAQNEGEQDVSTSLLNNLTEVLAGITHIEHYFEPPMLIKSEEGAPGGVVTTPMPGIIAFRNGVLNLDKWLSTSEIELSPHTPDLFTLVALPYDFDPNASCPRWLAFLEENLKGNEERIKLLQEFAGYCLTYDTKLHKFLLLYGDAATGKSTFTSVLIAMLGQENISHVPLEGFAERFGLARTVGKLANIVSEVGELDRIAEGHLKEFVAGDRMQVERKFADPFEAKPTAKLIMATNNLPRFSDRSRGIWRRLIVIPFDYVVPEEKQDPELAQNIIQNELPGVFLWAAMGLARLRIQGRFSHCEEAEQLAREYERESNPARLFLEEHYEVAMGSSVACSEVYQSYRKWALDNGYQPLNERHFGQEVRRVFPKVERRYRGERGNRGYFYIDIRAVTATEEWKPNELQ